jgi:hypothetical protein
LRLSGFRLWLSLRRSFLMCLNQERVLDQTIFDSVVSNYVFQ